MSAFFPVVGLLLGALLAASYYLYSLIFPQPLVAALLVVTLVILTGGLHLDGFMDTMDGIFSGRSPDRQLEIMRDSRVGAFGVLGLACLLLVKFSIFTALPNHIFGMAMMLAMVLSRWSMSYVIVLFPYARKEGLGTLLNQHSGGREILLASLGAAILAVVLAGVAGLFMMLALWGWTHFFGHRLTSALGGLTGDIYGATAEISEILIYLLLFPLHLYLPVLFYRPLPWP